MIYEGAGLGPARLAQRSPCAHSSPAGSRWLRHTANNIGAMLRWGSDCSNRKGAQMKIALLVILIASLLATTRAAAQPEQASE
jgi:hypothetical protein